MYAHDPGLFLFLLSISGLTFPDIGNPIQNQAPAGCCAKILDSELPIFVSLLPFPCKYAIFSQNKAEKFS
jgi:hypothetical protein